MLNKRANVLLLSMLVLASMFLISSVSAATLFSDNFNSGINTSWVNSGVTTSSGYTVFNSADALTLSINTLAYANIQLQWSWKTNGFDLASTHSNFFFEYNDDGNWKQGWAINSENDWALKTQNLPSVSSLQIRFRFDNEPTVTSGNLDNVLITGDLKDTTAPVCSVDKLGSYFLSNPITYINSEGYFVTYGSANDSDSGFVNSAYPVSVNRTSPGAINIWSWVVADDVSQSPNWNNVAWNNEFPTSGGRNDYYAQGNHQICCKTADSAGNVFMGGCKDVCIDTQVPVMDSISDNTQDCSSDGNYWNQTSITFSWSAHDNGCAGIQTYNVKVYEVGDSAAIDDFNTTSTSAPISSLENGESYYIVVTPIDNAGNFGSSITSNTIMIDTEDPIVSIVSPESGAWFNVDFQVSETDTDTNLDKCYLQISNNGGETQDYTEVACNSVENIDISTYCPADGICNIFKKATDKACNDKGTSEEYNLDRTPPTTIKDAVGKFYSNGSLMNYLTYAIHYFLGTPSSLRFNCNDAGIGCDRLLVTIRDVNGTVVGTYNESITPTIRLDLVHTYPDGVYFVDYQSTDLLGNTEEVQSEIDKIDNLAPVTTKTIGQPQYQNAYYLTDHTPMYLTGVDSEVGCEETTWQISQGETISRIGETETCNESVDWTNLDDGKYNITFGSTDLLGNANLSQTTQEHYLDNTAPGIWIMNPFEGQEENKCSLDIGTEIWEFGSGLNESTTVANLRNSSGIVKSVSLAQISPLEGNHDGYFYTGVLDIAELASGIYTLEVIASDNLGNTRIETRTITLLPGITVERIDPATCSITEEAGGNCSFTFQVCVRDTSATSMWITKLYSVQNGQKNLLDVVNPFTLDGRITNSFGTAYVGLTELPYGRVPTNIDVLNLTATPCEKLNGRINSAFNLKLDFTPEVASIIGTNNYLFDFDLQGYNYDDVCLVEDITG